MSEEKLATVPIWFNGKIVNVSEAGHGILAHGLHYGAAVFGGVRCYRKNGRAAFFRLDDHIERVFRGARLLDITAPHDIETIRKGFIELARLMPTADYFRPLICYGPPIESGDEEKVFPQLMAGVAPFNSEVYFAIIADHWGSYLGEDALTHGVGVCMSPFARPTPHSGVTTFKGGWNYFPAQLAKMHGHELLYRRVDGEIRPCTDALFLNAVDGTVADLSGANVWVREGDVIRTSPADRCGLPGITRATILHWNAQKRLKGQGFDIREEPFTVQDIWVAHEFGASGTAAQFTGIVNVNGRTIGDGKLGRMSKAILGWFDEYIDVAFEPGVDPDGYMTIFDMR